MFRRNPSGNQVIPWARFFWAVTSTPRRRTIKATRIIPMRINFPPVGCEKGFLSSSFTPFTWYIGNVVDNVCVAAVAARKSAAWNYTVLFTISLYLILWIWNISFTFFNIINIKIYIYLSCRWKTLSVTLIALTRSATTIVDFQINNNTSWTSITIWHLPWINLITSICILLDSYSCPQMVTQL